MNAGDSVTNAQVRPDRSLPRKTIYIPEATDTFAHRGKTRFVCIGTVLTIAGDPGIDQTRIMGSALRGSQAPVFHHTGAKIFDHHIGTINQLPGELAPGLLFESQCDTFFIPPQTSRPKRSPLCHHTPSAYGISGFGWFNLDDLRTKVSQHAASKGAGQDRKSTRLNSSHVKISYAVFCLKKKIHPKVEAHA